MTKQQNDKERANFFITLELRDKRPAFREEGFRTQVEQHWAVVMQQEPDLWDTEYVVNDTAVHALISLPSNRPEAREVLGRAISTFMALSRADYKGDRELWADEYKIRPIESLEELHSLRDFIVQKMLGGKELSNLEEKAEEDDHEDYY